MLVLACRELAGFCFASKSRQAGLPTCSFAASEALHGMLGVVLRVVLTFMLLVLLCRVVHSTTFSSSSSNSTTFSSIESSTTTCSSNATTFS